MNNLAFGKTMENIRNKQTIERATFSEQASKLINKPSLKQVQALFDSRKQNSKSLPSFGDNVLGDFH